MKKRNEFLEINGLYFVSDTHEWFNDKTSTKYAQEDNVLHKDALPHIACFVVRDKKTGEYNRVVLDTNKNELIHDDKTIEGVAMFIDKLKLMKRYKDE